MTLIALNQIKDVVMTIPRLMCSNLAGLPALQKIADFALSHFLIFQHMGIAAVGGKEVALDSLSQKWKNNAYTYNPRNKEYFEVHGFFLITSGIFGLLGQKLRSLAFSLLARGFYSISSLVALVHNIHLFFSSIDSQIKISAFLGILSNLSDILSLALILLGASGTMALVFGCLAVSLGGVKFLYELFAFK